MQTQSKRIEEKTRLEIITKFIHDYAYIETLTIVATYLVFGYMVNPNDICILNSDVSYILILLAVITLFHGFENGVLAMTIIALVMWSTYESFQYIEFLVALLMTMIFSEFHYYWTKKIKKAQIDADYRGNKLDELSKAFYSLKISHDQLEKNYVIKPMSIRNSIEFIVNQHKEIKQNPDIQDKSSELYKRFLGLLSKSFNVNSALIVYKIDTDKTVYMDENNTDIAYGEHCEKLSLKEVFKDYLVDKAVSKNTAIYISDKEGEPNTDRSYESDFIAAIPSLNAKKANLVLAIQKMPFMAFNRENLTAISILLEYFSIEIMKKEILSEEDEIAIVLDENFRFEFTRLKHLYDTYKVNSIILVIRINNELQATRIHEKIIKMLRSLDMVTIIHENENFYLSLLFPLHDKSAAIGYMNRLINSLEEEKDKKFDYMIFDLSQTELLNKYYREDYAN